MTIPDSKRQWLDKLIETLALAKEAAVAASTDDDGGTCNFDSATLFPDHRLSDADIAEITEKAGVSLCKTKWMGRVCYWIGFGGSFGQGNNNTRTAEAGNKVLKDAGFDVMMYYQMD